MGKQVKIDSDVFRELINRAIDKKAEKTLLVWALDSGKFSNSEVNLNEVLRDFLGMSNKEEDVNNNYPSSKVQEVQLLLNGLKETIFNISKNGMRYYTKHKRWVADPNIVTITVQDARAHSLRITVYGRPYEFEEVESSLDIKGDMAGYSRFTINNERQIPATVNVIKHSYELKQQRGRI
jgi:hypothetical protein